ncbi:cilia- and flagella-associated protein 36 isoform X2 [Ascaphus truei]|uniref:cilia- and flagella-associated protein 36 isoform X2 n=1 Tax=Ascaphus truei TaxID=8439 RepID=UPI003F5A939E
MAEDAEWVLETVLGFLGGPIWSIPVLDFMEQRCSVFDDDDENKLSYTEIHDEYKELVEKLLEGHLREVGISEEQLQEACTAPLARSPALKNILQPVLAVDDFKMFKAMMVQKNIELQLQAIKIIQERNGVLPDCLTNGTDTVSDLEQQEIKLISEAMRLSKEEYEQEQLRKVTTTSSPDSSGEPSLKEVSTGNDRTVTFAEEAVDPHEAIKQTLKIEAILIKAPSIKLKEMSNTEAAEAWLEQARKEAGILGSVTSLSQTEKEQLRQRADYLKQKRGELLAKKMESSKTRPNTDDYEEKASSSRQEMTEEEKKNFQKRKHLAEKLIEEVINNSCI